MAWPKLVGISSIAPPPPPPSSSHSSSSSSHRRDRPRDRDDGDGDCDYRGNYDDDASSTHSYLLPPPPTGRSRASRSPSFSPVRRAAAVPASPPSPDAEQIERDVARATWHLLTGSQRSRNFQMRNKHRRRIVALLRKKQRRLGDFLNLVLAMSCCDHDRDHCNDGEVVDDDDGGGLRYYQGFHDVGSIVLSALGGVTTSPPPLGPGGVADAGVYDDGDGDDDARLRTTTHATASSMGLDLACRVLLRISRSHLRDAMRSNFRTLQVALKLVVMPLAAAFDPELHSHLHDCEMEPYFCLSWVITWFSHDVRDTRLVKRLYDFFIASHPLMAVYVSVAMMIHPLNRIEVLGADCDFACVHHALADLPKNSSNVGWRYLPGVGGGDTHGNGGYVTGEDDDASYDSSLQDRSYDDDGNGSLVPGSGGPASPSGRPKNGGGGRRARVPFQELIDLAVSLMHKIPPRNLINLAKRYHAEITLRPLMAQSSSIALLQPPPSWALASRVESDWAIRQRMRSEGGYYGGGSTTRKLNRHQRKNRLKLGPPMVHLRSGDIGAASRPLPLDGPSVHAIIASGMGPDGLAEARKSRKKRRLIARGSVVLVVSVLVALASNYYYSDGRPPARPSSSSSPSHQLTTGDVPIEDSGVSRMPLLPSGDSDATTADNNGDVLDDNYEEGEPSVIDSTAESDNEIDSDTQREVTVKVQVNIPKNMFDVCVDDEVSCFFLNQA